MSENKENTKRKVQEKLHRNFMQMSELESILEMEKQVFEEDCKRRNEELERKRLDIQGEEEALREILKENKALQKSIMLKRSLELDDEALTKIARENIELSERVSALEREKEELQRNFDNQLENLTAENQKQISDLEESLSLEEKESAKYKKSAKDLKEKLDRMRKKVASSLREITAKLALTKGAKEEIKRNTKLETEKMAKELLESRKSVQAILKANNEAKDTLKQRLAASEAQQKKNSDAIRKLESDLQKRDLELREFESSARLMSDGLKQSLKALDEKHSALEKDHLKQQKLIAELNAELKAANKQKEDEVFHLKKVICSKDDAIDGIKEQLESVKQSMSQSTAALEKSLRQKESECRTLRGKLDMEKLGLGELEAKNERELQSLRQENEKLRQDLANAERRAAQGPLENSQKGYGIAENWGGSEAQEGFFSRPDEMSQNDNPLMPNNPGKEPEEEEPQEQGWGIDNELAPPEYNAGFNGAAELLESAAEPKPLEDAAEITNQLPVDKPTEPEGGNINEEGGWLESDILITKESEEQQNAGNQPQAKAEGDPQQIGEGWGPGEESEAWREPEQGGEVENLAEDEIRQSKLGFPEADENVVIANRISEEILIVDQEEQNLGKVVEKNAESVEVTNNLQEPDFKQQEEEEENLSHKFEADQEADSKDLMEGGWEDINDPILHKKLIQSPVEYIRKPSPSLSEQNSRNIQQLEAEFSKWDEERKEMSQDARKQEPSIDESSINAARLDIEDISKDFELSAKLLSDHRLLDEDVSTRMGRKQEKRLDGEKNSYSDKKRGRSEKSKYVSSRRKNDSADGRIKSSREVSLDEENEEEETKNWGIDFEAEDIIYKNTLAQEELEPVDNLASEHVIAEPLRREISEIRPTGGNIFASIDFSKEKLHFDSNFTDHSQEVDHSKDNKIEHAKKILNDDILENYNEEHTGGNAQLMVEEEPVWPALAEDIQADRNSKDEAPTVIAMTGKEGGDSEIPVDGSNAASNREEKQEEKACDERDKQVPREENSEEHKKASGLTEQAPRPDTKNAGQEEAAATDDHLHKIGNMPTQTESLAEAVLLRKEHQTAHESLELARNLEKAKNQEQEKALHSSDIIHHKQEKKTEGATNEASQSKAAKPKFPVGKPGLFGSGLVINKVPVMAGAKNVGAGQGGASLFPANPKKKDDDIDLESILGNKFMKK